MKKLLLPLLLIWGFVCANAQNYTSVPSRIEAEDYNGIHDAGTETTADTGGGSNIGSINNGSWIDYNIKTSQAGGYTLQLRVANGFNDNAEVHIKNADGTRLAGTIVPRTGGMQAWQTISLFVTLPAGNQTIRVYAQNGLFNLNWIEFVAPKLLTARIEAEDFNAATDVRPETTADTGGGSNLGYIDDEDWMDYHVKVANSGVHTFSFRVANAYGNGIIQIRNQNADVLGSVNVPQTGGWQTYTTVSTTATLNAGDQVIRLFLPKGTFNFNWFEVAEGGQAEQPTQSVITFEAIPAVKVGGNSFNLYATSNNALSPVTFTSSNPSVIALTNNAGTWIATILAEGNTSITASQAGNGSFTEAENVTRNVIVQPADPTTPATYTQIPSRIEAENYSAIHDAGTETTADTGGGSNIGSINNGSWIDYNIKTSQAGGYTLQLRVANGFNDNAEVHIKNAEGIKLAGTIVPRTGGMQAWQTISLFVTLPAGNQTIRVYAQNGLFNLNWIEFVAPKLLTGRIEAEDFNAATDVRPETTADTGGGSNLGYIDDEDWMDYHVKVANSGVHTFSFRVANAYGNGIIQIRNQNADVLGSVNVPQTGGWQTYTTVSTTATLNAGDQIIRLFMPKGTFNFNWFEVAEGGQAEQPTQSVITFEAIPAVKVGGNSFNLYATSNNALSPVTFTSSNPSVIALTNNAGTWIATILAEGNTNITASQAGNGSFTEAENVTRNVIVQPADPVSNAQKITLDPKRWYQLTNAANGLDQLFDGNLTETLQTGWGKVISEYEAYYPLLEGEEMTIESLRFFDLEGSNTQNPAKLSIITDQWERIEIARFTGDRYNGWVGPYPERNLSGNAQFLLDAPVGNIRYLIWDIRGIMPTEMEIYGTHTPATVTPSPVPAKSVRLGDMFGVNGYEWNFQHGAKPWENDENLVNAAKNFKGLRHYLDWEKLESSEGVYSFNPTLIGGWHYDLMYERCKQENIEILACIKTLPGWMLATYPEGHRETEFVPVKSGKNFADPLSYIEQAKVAFQFTARYGRNTSVDPSLLSVYSEPRWPGDNPNTIKIGLDLVKYLECDNERDKWWKGRMGYQTAREYAANLSAFYDGHKNTMGPGVGVKNADPSMLVVIAGLVTGPDYVKGMVDWCKEFRGYNPDGTVNLCWDVINFHLYTDNTSSAQSGTSTRGMSAEMTPANIIVEEFMKVAHEICYDMPVWLTETGFDVQPNSPIKAIPIGNKSALETQADWTIRTSLFSARKGIDKVYFYQMYDDNPLAGMFGSSGLLNTDQTRRPAADYIVQINKLFGNYRYKETIYSDPIVDRYELDGQSLYILAVPDEVGRTADYILNLPGSSKAQIYRPVIGGDDMSLEELPVANGKVNITATETPMFVLGAGNLNARRALIDTALTQLTNSEEIIPLQRVVSVYPNPTADYITVDLANTSTGNIELRIFDTGTGRLYKKETLSKSENNFKQKISVAHLPTGSYIVEVIQGQDRAFRKIIKTH
ncbi:carbohydrate-binding protein [Dyadobacter luteus]|uniref:Carbohydrate-binding protein n=1 Tax=Dyadobacter luteus TaxID=2259619 RepID=A0A3D8Y7F9_9BACT|nr:carbohydrate-binding protein [Dyadobacter luteus]REA58996.1 carbohydrate-binding protein [Dyadobacter luteus]